MVVVFVIAILGALAVPMLRGTDASRLRSAALMLQSDIDFARGLSITDSDDPAVLTLDAVNHGYHVGLSSNPATAIQNPATRTPYVVVFGEGSRAGHLGGVRIVSLDVGGDDALGFGRYGQLDQADDAAIDLASGDFELSVRVDATLGEASIGAMH